MKLIDDSKVQIVEVTLNPKLVIKNWFSDTHFWKLLLNMIILEANGRTKKYL